VPFGDQELVEYLTRDGYHPRSNKHGTIVCLLLLKDVLETCGTFRKLAAERRIVYRIDYPLAEGTPDSWTMDLVVGPPREISRKPKHKVPGIEEGTPAEIWVAIDAKSIMTEHGKARRNRFRDVTALERRVHGMNEQAVVGACLTLNMSPSFRSQLRKAGSVTVHTHIEKLVKDTIELFEGVGFSDTLTGRRALDALGIVVVEHSNEPGKQTLLVTKPPAPQPGDRTHYRSFLTDLCRCFTERFGSK